MSSGSDVPLYLQIGALIGIISTAIYLFIAIKNYFKTAKEEKAKNEKEYKERIEEIKQEVVTTVINNLGARFDTLSRDFIPKDQLLKEFIDIHENIDALQKWTIEADKKFLIFNMRLKDVNRSK